MLLRLSDPTDKALPMFILFQFMLQQQGRLMFNIMDRRGLWVCLAKLFNTCTKITAVVADDLSGHARLLYRLFKLGSSEVLESVFGKLKNLEGAQSKSGFTGLVLSVAAMVSKTTVCVVKAALEEVSTEAVRRWCREKLGQSVQSTRRRALVLSDKSEQKQDQLLRPA